MSTAGRRTDRKLAFETDHINEVSFKFIDDDIYFRITVVDEFGKRANTCAYFVKDLLG